MTWTRHRPKGLSWALLLAFVLVLIFSVQRYVTGEVAIGEDTISLMLRVGLLVLLAITYLRTGGSTAASPDGLVVHNGVRAVQIAAASVAKIHEDPKRGGAVAVLTTGRRVELPGVAANDIRDLRRQLRSR